MTLASRILGMVRDIVCAGVFGTSVVWDAFIYAFTFPNFLRGILGEGTLTGVFVPVYSGIEKREGKPAAERFAQRMFTLLFLSVGFLVAVMMGILFLMNRWISFGARSHLIVQLLIILFPYILFLSLYALAMALLNSRNYFFVPTLGPVILNTVWIVAVIGIAPLITKSPEGQVKILAGCLLGAGLMQFLLQLIPLGRDGFRLKWDLAIHDAHIRKVFQLFGPAVLGFGVLQVNILFDRTLAFFVGAGANSSLWYGHRLMLLPIGLVAVPMGVALLPKISEHAAEENLEEFSRDLSFSLRMVFTLIIPATAGLIALGVPIVRIMFERGAFDAVSTARTVNTLRAYALGLFAFSGIKLAVSAFYAFKDTKTPVKIGSYCVLLDIVLNLILMWPLRETGLALTTTLTGTVNFLVLMNLLHRRRCRMDLRGIGTAFLKSCLASFVMAIFVSWCFARLGGVTSSTTESAIRLIVTIVLGVAVYLTACAVLRMPEVKKLFALTGLSLYDAQGDDI